MKRLAFVFALLPLLACDQIVDVTHEVVAVKVPTVRVEIARLHRVADLVLVNELDILRLKGFECEQKDIETVIVPYSNDGSITTSYVMLRELWACWKITYEVVEQTHDIG